MTSRMRQTRATVRHWRNFLTGALIGTLVQTPVFAASEILPGEWTARLEHDWPSVVAVIAVVVIAIGAAALAVRARSRAAARAPVADPKNSIGRYRTSIRP
jgi:membrane protein DedA with SNARE-associated domain